MVRWIRFNYYDLKKWYWFVGSKVRLLQKKRPENRLRARVFAEVRAWTTWRLRQIQECSRLQHVRHMCEKAKGSSTSSTAAIFSTIPRTVIANCTQRCIVPISTSVNRLILRFAGYWARLYSAKPKYIHTWRLLRIWDHVRLRDERERDVSFVRST